MRAREKNFGKFFRIGEEIFRGEGVLEISKGCVKENEKHRGGREKNLDLRGRQNVKKFRKFSARREKFFAEKNFRAGDGELRPPGQGAGRKHLWKGVASRKNRVLRPGKKFPVTPPVAGGNFTTTWTGKVKKREKTCASRKKNRKKRGEILRGRPFPIKVRKNRKKSKFYEVRKKSKNFKNFSRGKIHFCNFGNF